MSAASLSAMAKSGPVNAVLGPAALLAGLAPSAAPPPWERGYHKCCIMGLMHQSACSKLGGGAAQRRVEQVR